MHPANQGATQIQHNQVNVTTSSTPTLIKAADVNTSRRGILVRNMDKVNFMWVGTDGLTITNGYPIQPLEAVLFDSAANIFGIADTATVKAAWISTHN